MAKMLKANEQIIADYKESYNIGWSDGIKHGERAASRRVKEAIDRLTLTGYRGNPEGYVDAKTLKEQLGLDEVKEE